MLMDETGGTRILVVVNDRWLHDVVVVQLEKLGYHPIPASNGLEGLATLARTNVHGIVLDLEMPMMNGLTVLRRLRDQYPMIPVLILSGHASREVFSPLAPVKNLDYLLKPFYMNELTDRCLRLFV